MRKLDERREEGNHWMPFAYEGLTLHLLYTPGVC